MNPDILEFILSQFHAQATYAADRAAGIAADRAARNATERTENVAKEAAAQAAQSVRDEIKEALKNSFSGAESSHARKRREPPSPVEPTRAKARVPKRRGADTNALFVSVQSRCVFSFN